MTNLQEQIDHIPQSPGVYIFRSHQDTPLYVGKSSRLKDRARSYFHKSAELGPRTRRLIEQIERVEHIQTETELEALLLEAELIKRLKPPFNVQWKDDKHYKYIQVANYQSYREDKRETLEQEVWPIVRTSRRKDDPTSIYFGPFPEGNAVNKVLKTLRKIFPWCRYKSTEEARRAGRPCFYYHIGQCPGICNNNLTLQEYWKITDDLVHSLHGEQIG